MAFKFFKRKRKEEKEKPVQKSVGIEVEKEKKEKSALVKPTPDLFAPHISEKSTQRQVEGEYVFRIFGNPAKPVIRRSIEQHYGVLVESVRTIKAQSKKRRRGAIVGRKRGFKKAVVTLQKGHTINELTA